jgi:hypothetical protein
MNTIHQTKKAIHLSELSAKLQKEVDAILMNVDERTLFAEFKQEEIYDLKEGKQDAVFLERFDERVTIAPRKYAPRQSQPRKITTRVKSAIQFLFAPVEFQ